MNIQITHSQCANIIKIIIVAILLVYSNATYSQYIEDALRFVKPNASISPRASALGFAYFGFSDDASALVSNPAGLTLIPSSELGLGLNYTRNKTSTNFMGNIKTDNTNEFYFSNVQFVFANINSELNKIKFGFSYNVDNDYTINTRYSGFNNQNSLVAQQADAQAEWTTITGLADKDFHTSVQNNMQQDGFVIEDGGLHNFSMGMGFDVSDMFAFGATFTMKFGSYDYTRRYYENDIQNLHNTKDDNISQLYVKDKLNQDLFGISGLLGMQIRLNELLRIGVSMKFPTLLIDSEYFYSNYEVYYDNAGNNHNNYSTGSFSQSYSIITPFEFTLGLSGNLLGLSYSVAGSYSDASSAYFDNNFENNAYDNIIFWDDLNEQMKNELQSQFTIGAALEYKIPLIPIYARGSYTLITSPYKNATYGSNKSIIGLGLGMLMSNNFILDVAFNYSTENYQRANYGNVDMPNLFSFYKVDNTPSSFILGIRYRFD
jgi:hypothetical protein